ncbi:hypothetical protein [Actinomyces qiguomingii]|nr:hypothetical protein [Actinomyces qiguomingii]
MRSATGTYPVLKVLISFMFDTAGNTSKLLSPNQFVFCLGDPQS